MCRTRKIHQTAAILLALALLLTLAPSALAAETASTMQLTKTEGTVTVTNASGRDLSVREKMRLYSGYVIKTGLASYAWVALDSTKLVKLDANSEVEIHKNGKSLELLIQSGSLFFNVTEPLKEDETLNICTSTMVAGVRGTIGYARSIRKRMQGKKNESEGAPEVRPVSTVSLLEGRVQCKPTIGMKQVTVKGGENISVNLQAHQAAIKALTSQDIPGFVLVDVVQDAGLISRITQAGMGDLVNVTPAQAQEKLKEDEQNAQREADAVKDEMEALPGQVQPAPGSSAGSASSDSSGGSGSSGGSSNSGSSGSNNPGGETGKPDVPVNPDQPAQPGDSGDSGDSGNQGDSGNSGDSGNQGDSGNSGDSGNQGDSGNSGDSGNQGDSGDSGDSGNQETKWPIDTGDFTVEGGKAGDYSFRDSDNGHVLTIEKAATLAIKGNSTKDRIVVSKDAGDVNITLDNVNIDTSSIGEAAFLIQEGYSGNVTVNLAQNSDNKLTSGTGCAGLQKGATGTLTITGTGKLTAAGGDKNVGIGGMDYPDAESEGGIVIKGGTVIASGGADPTNTDAKLAGIGYGYSVAVTIKGNAFVYMQTGSAELNYGEFKLEQGTVVYYENQGGAYEKIIGATIGNVTLHANTTVPAGAQWTIPADATLTIPEGITLTIPEGAYLYIDDGKIHLEGVIQANGGIAGYNGNVDGNGKIYNKINEELYSGESGTPAMMSLRPDMAQAPAVPATPEASTEPATSTEPEPPAGQETSTEPDAPDSPEVSQDPDSTQEPEEAENPDNTQSPDTESPEDPDGEDTSEPAKDSDTTTEDSNATTPPEGLIPSEPVIPNPGPAEDNKESDLTEPGGQESGEPEDNTDQKEQQET